MDTLPIANLEQRLCKQCKYLGTSYNQEFHQCTNPDCTNNDQTTLVRTYATQCQFFALRKQNTTKRIPCTRTSSNDQLTLNLE